MVLGLATGSTPEKMYDYLVDMLNKNKVDLGIGRNGHIAFNEPGTAFDSETHVVDLTETTVNDNARFFDTIDEVPKQGHFDGAQHHHECEIFSSSRVFPSG